jgi:hypothetical protein
MKYFLTALLLSSLAHADIMNLNEFMPTRLQDATPIDQGSIDIQMSAELSQEGAITQTVFRPNFRAGVTDRFQFEVYGTQFSGGEESESGEIAIGGLYQINESDTMVPMFAWNPMIVVPTGKASDGIDLNNEIVLTSTLRGTARQPKTQFHLNLDWIHDSQNKTDHRANRGFYGFGVSQLLGERMALVVDLIREEESEEGNESNNLEAGIHQDLGKEFYLSLGASAGFGGTSASWTALLAIEKQIDGVL